MSKETKKIAILGASRGLGKALVENLQSSNVITNLLLVSRKENLLSVLCRKESDQFLVYDFTKEDGWDFLINDLIKFNPHQIWYIAGGGPYGFFHEKKFSSHLWTYKLNFVFPSYLLHQCLGEKFQNFENLKKIVFVGSSVAEDKPDPMAASYCAGKHALKGLLSTVELENQNNPKLPGVYLYSPSYMKTEMLPDSSWPIQDGIAHLPKDVAEHFISLYLS